MGNQAIESLFAMDDFRLYIRVWAQTKGRGEFRKIAESLRMHTTLVSQVLNGRKCLTEEQASILCSYMGLSTLESDYFLKLVQLERAGNESLKITFRRHLKQLREQAKEAKSRVPETKEMSEQDQAVYYSSWQYSVIRLLTSIERFQTVEEIARYLGLSLSRVREILLFLVSRGLCKRASDGKYSRTERNTHIEARSPLAIRHHQNWRTKALALQEHMTLDDLVFTSPLSISRKDFQRIRGMLLDMVSAIAKAVEKSTSEEIVYLGIDWINWIVPVRFPLGNGQTRPKTAPDLL